MKTKITREEKLAIALAFVSRSVFDEVGLGPDCCIVATRAGIDVLSTWGIKGRPVLCEAVAANGAFRSGNRDPRVAYVVQVDAGIETKPADREMREHPDDRHGLHGHLVIAARAGKRYVALDLSAYQFDRPTRHIIVPTGLAIDTRGPLIVGGEWRFTADLPELGVLLYREHPKPKIARYTTAGDWTLPTDFHRRMHQRVVRSLKARAEEAVRTSQIEVLS